MVQLKQGQRREGRMGTLFCFCCFVWFTVFQLEFGLLFFKIILIHASNVFCSGGVVSTHRLCLVLFLFWLALCIGGRNSGLDGRFWGNSSATTKGCVVVQADVE